MASMDLYRAKEKIIYKFISRELVCAYDNKRRLLLNSCNAFIPKIPNLSSLYILAILNSSLMEYYYHYNFNTVKVLKYNLQQLPIVVDMNHKETLEKYVSILVDDCKKEYIDKIDDMVFQLYNLSQNDIYEIRKFKGCVR